MPPMPRFSLDRRTTGGGTMCGLVASGAHDGIRPCASEDCTTAQSARIRARERRRADRGTSAKTRRLPLVLLRRRRNRTVPAARCDRHSAHSWSCIVLICLAEPPPLMGQTLPRLRFASVAAPSTPPPNDAPIFSLPSVMIQSCMQFAPAADIIALARCSKRLYRDGGEPFAWKFAVITLTIDRTQPPPTLLEILYTSSKQLLWKSAALVPWMAQPAAVRQPFLAHAHITLNWPIRGHNVPPSHVQHTVLELLDRLPPLRCFTSTVVSSPPVAVPRARVMPVCEAFCLILAHPKLQSLVSLKLYDASRRGYATAPMMAAIAALPKLSHLDIGVSAGVQNEIWEPISSCHALTSLHLHDNQNGQGPNRLTHVARCPHLTALSISMPSLHGSQFRTFFQSEHMRRLVRLKLDWLHCNGRVSLLCEGIPQADLAAVFPTMTMLEEIHLSRVHDVGAMLPHLAQAPALRKCIIQPECDLSGRVGQHNSTVPSEAILRALLDDAPRLEVRLFLQSSSANPRPIEHVPPISLVHMRHQLSALIATMTEAYPRRFAVDSELSP